MHRPEAEGVPVKSAVQVWVWRTQGRCHRERERDDEKQGGQNELPTLIPMGNHDAADAGTIYLEHDRPHESPISLSNWRGDADRGEGRGLYTPWEAYLGGVCRMRTVVYAEEDRKKGGKEGKRDEESRSRVCGALERWSQLVGSDAGGEVSKVGSRKV